MTHVRTQYGRLEGRLIDGIHTFLGVPYAAPLSAGRRFALPQEPKPWRGVRPALAHGPVCPQIPTYGPVGRGATSALNAGEDCLTLNIRTQDTHDKAPVLVWVHGGGYAVGSANEAVLQSGAFAANGIVEVTLNYRLGALGFLHLDGAPDNRGLLDIICALKWVRDNIASFGGDPARVTLAGRSAGGFAVATLMAMPEAHGLFSRALIQSGATPAVLPIHCARRTTERFLSCLGGKGFALETMDIANILNAQKQICDESYESHDWHRDGSVTVVGIPFQPVIDPHTLPYPPEQAVTMGGVAPIPVMIGTTSAEYLTHSRMHPHLTYNALAPLLDPRVRPLGLSGQIMVERYRQALPEHSPIGLWRAIAGDLVFQNPTTRYASLLCQTQPVYKYLYGDIQADETGAAHGAELAEVWWREGMHVENLPQRYHGLNEVFARQVHAIWRSFIADPTPVLPDGSHWSSYGLSERTILSLSVHALQQKKDPFAVRETLWHP
ncbi:carboxylesterase/lipase family protein [Acetobacter garciniae]|uniref:carboxylesterase/lipase family protein n=1 Tax=Acetobacter garciniae TaxID=2817435 RepID=UPI002ED9430B